MASERELLPTSVVPSFYKVFLDLSAFPSSFEFSGKVVISVEVKQETSQVTFHANALVLKKALIKSLSLKTESSQESTAISYDTAKETATITFSQVLAAGSHAELEIEYSGTINDLMCGFYRSKYTKQDGQVSHIATTQFEATDCRRAFPCWDEPSIKAKFDISMRVPSNYEALSNMNAISKTPSQTGSNTYDIQFATTPIMSTYLIAFIVGEFEYLEAETAKNHIKVRVYTPLGMKDQGIFSLDVGCKVLDFFEEYFGIPYPLPKCDHVAIPDFTSGAMENWGLITYRLNALLFDEKASSLSAKQRVAYVVSHELAHQWFGNLCTMEWWTDLWLNEGFATWVGWLAVDHVFPEWNVWVQFLTDDFRRAMDLDALRSSHPIEVEIKRSGEIGSIFDAISYCKGASVIRMLFNFLERSKAVDGLRQYLQKHIYANAATKDLWAALDLSSGIDVSQMMNSWTKQTGHPVVAVEDEVVNGETVVKLSQTRFLSGGKPTAEEDVNTWWVPLGVTTSKTYGQVQQSLFNTKSLTLNLGDLGQGFFKLNHKHNGFFRTIYSPQNLAKLGKAVAAGELSAIEDRVGLLSDVFALSCAGFAPTVQALELVSHYSREEDYVVWNEILDNLGTLKSLYYNQGSGILDGFDLFIRSLVSPKVRELGWDPRPGESVLTNMLRSLIIRFAGNAGHPDVVKEAFRRFSAFRSGDTTAIHPNIRDEIYGIVVRFGGVTEYEQMLDLYRTSATVDGKLAALVSLCRTRAPELIERTLQFGLSEEVKPQDIIYVFAGIKGNALGRDKLWDFVQKNWALLHERYYAGLMIMSRVVQHSTNALNSLEMAKQVEGFFYGGGAGSLPVDNLKRIIDQSLEQIRIQANWLSRDRDSVVAYIDTNRKAWSESS